jgi:hypothetical protein
MKLTRKRESSTPLNGVSAVYVRERAHPRLPMVIGGAGMSTIGVLSQTKRLHCCIYVDFTNFRNSKTDLFHSRLISFDTKQGVTGVKS